MHTIPSTPRTTPSGPTGPTAHRTHKAGLAAALGVGLLTAAVLGTTTARAADPGIDPPRPTHPAASAGQKTSDPTQTQAGAQAGERRAEFDQVAAAVRNHGRMRVTLILADAPGTSSGTDSGGTTTVAARAVVA